MKFPKCVKCKEEFSGRNYRSTEFPLCGACHLIEIRQDDERPNYKEQEAQRQKSFEQGNNSGID